MPWFGPRTWTEDARLQDRRAKWAAKDRKRQAKARRKRGTNRPRKQVLGPFYWQ